MRGQATNSLYSRENWWDPITHQLQLYKLSCALTSFLDKYYTGFQSTNKYKLFVCQETTICFLTTTNSSFFLDYNKEFTIAPGTDKLFVSCIARILIIQTILFADQFLGQVLYLVPVNEQIVGTCCSTDKLFIFVLPHELQLYKIFCPLTSFIFDLSQILWYIR